MHGLIHSTIGSHPAKSVPLMPTAAPTFNSPRP